jgi:signal transduction histidine kinase/ActR/RegA family two-component response regulator
MPQDPTIGPGAACPGGKDDEVTDSQNRATRGPSDAISRDLSSEAHDERGLWDRLTFPRTGDPTSTGGDRTSGGDDIQRMRARLVVRIAILSVPFWLFYGVVWYSIGLPLGLLLACGGALGCLVWIPAQRAGVSALTAGRGIAVVSASTFLSLALFVRGLDVSLFAWNLLIPVTAVLFRSTRTALGWTLIISASWLLLLGLDRFGLLPTPDDHLPPLFLKLLSLWNLIGTMLMLVMIVGTHARVQAKRQAEREELRQKLNEAEHWAGLGTLAASIGHEINNPLAFTLHNLEYLSELERRERSPNDDGPQALADALDGARRVQRIAERLNAMARPNQEPAPLALDQPVQVALALAQSALLGVREVQVNIPADLSVVATEELVQVVLNLLVNAADAIASQPERRESGQIVVEAYADGADAVLEVCDNGVGIPQEHRDRIFEPFFTTKEPGKGTGLGLAISAQVVRRLGGTLTAESREPRGTRMKVRLPLATAETPSRGKVASIRARHARILIIDDEPLLLRAMRRHLREFQVDTASDTSQALALLRAHSHELILCDVMMPETTGPEFYQKVARELGQEVAERFVFMTGGAFLPGEVEALRKTGRTTLPKPIDALAVVSELQRFGQRNDTPSTE